MTIRSLLTSILTPPDRLLAKIIGKGFGLKDIFTLVNLGGGVAGIILAMKGKPIEASYAVLIGFILGDSLDGAVARLTGHSNRFGSDFDTITDHLAQCIAPAVIVASHFFHYNYLFAGLLAFMIISAGSIRHARNTAADFNFHFCWKGLPRPIATMIIFAVLNGQIIKVVPYPQYFALAAVIGVSYGLLGDIPFVSHHGRRLQNWVIGIVIFAYSTAILLGLFYRKYFWDVLLLYMLVYTFFGWIVLSPEERKEYRQAVADWKSRLI